MWSFRKPSPMLRLLRWHKDFMRGLNPDRSDGHPECGWYRMQKTKNGPWVPVKIWCEQITDENGCLEQPERLRADVFGEDEDAEKIWTWLTPVSRTEYKELWDFRLKNQHRYDNHRAIDLADEPTAPMIG